MLAWSVPSRKSVLTRRLSLVSWLLAPFLSSGSAGCKHKALIQVQHTALQYWRADNMQSDARISLTESETASMTAGKGSTICFKACIFIVSRARHGYSGDFCIRLRSFTNAWKWQTKGSDAQLA